MILIAWWSGLALLAAFLFAGLADVTDRPTAAVQHGHRSTEKVRYELDNAA